MGYFFCKDPDVVLAKQYFAIRPQELKHDQNSRNDLVCWGILNFSNSI
jgi:hypothetical protein